MPIEEVVFPGCRLCTGLAVPDGVNKAHAGKRKLLVRAVVAETVPASPAMVL